MVDEGQQCSVRAARNANAWSRRANGAGYPERSCFDSAALRSTRTDGAPRVNSRRREGFTLIEVLVALAIVSIALLAALRAAGQGTSGATDLRSRLLAGWVAENVLAEHRARGDWLPLGIQRGDGRQAGMDFTWREEVTALPNPAFRRVDVFVYAVPDESRFLARLTGFVVQPPGLVR